MNQTDLGPQDGTEQNDLEDSAELKIMHIMHNNPAKLLFTLDYFTQRRGSFSYQEE